MARRQSANVEGIDRLRRALRELEKVAGSGEAVQDSADEVARLTRSRVHVDTHALQANVEVRPESRDKRKYLVGWGNPRVNRYSWKQEYGTKYIPANPALTAAAEQVVSHLRRRVEQQVKDAS